jgi:hypothetical protein
MTPPRPRTKRARELMAHIKAELKSQGRKENDRWWQVFVSVLNPAARPWLKSPAADTEIGLVVSVENAADVADAALAEARKRNR